MADPALLIQTAMARMRADVHDLAAWATLFMVLAQTGDRANLAGLLATRQRSLGDGLGFYYYVMRDLVALGQDRLAAEVAGWAPPESAEAAVGRYIEGVIAARSDRSERAVALIRAGAAGLDTPAVRERTRSDRLYRDHGGRHIATEAALIEPADAVQALASEPQPDLAPIRWPDQRSPAPDPAGQGPMILLAGCDRGYARRFAPGLLASLAAVTGGTQILHLHVVNPDGETEADLKAMTATYPFLRVSLEDGERNAVYYSCVRLLVLRRLFCHYQRPICSIDVDIDWTGSPGPLATVTAGRDLAWFEQRDRWSLPTLISDCRLAWFAPTAATDRFLALLERFITTKLQAGLGWKLDQAGLWSVSRALRADLDRIDLARALGAPYAGLLRPVEAEATKTALRAAADRLVSD